MLEERKMFMLVFLSVESKKLNGNITQLSNLVE